MAAVAAAAPAPAVWPAPAASPLLLPQREEKAAAAEALLKLPQLVLRRVVREVSSLLVAPNSALGAPFLQGNFAPVHRELHEQDLQLVTAANARALGAPLAGAGPLPAGLEGAFLRIGPNPLLKPLGGFHWFDGDGHVHSLRVKGGKAAYCNRWVPTSRLAQEAAAGFPLFVKLGDHVGLRGLCMVLLEKAKRALGVIDKSNGSGAANTAMVVHASRLLALHEGDLPYALRVMCDGLLEAVGRVTATRGIGESFTAHPKLCPSTGELHGFRYTFDAPPYVSYGVLGPKGDLLRVVHVGEKQLPRPSMMHDMALTKSYAVLLDNPLVFSGERMVKEGNLPFVFRPELGSRVGLLPRGATCDDEILWFTLEPHMVFHVANAFEDEATGVVKLFVCHTETISLNLDSRTAGGIPEAEQPRLALITLDPKDPSRRGALRVLTKTVGDFPQVNPRYATASSRYAYVATMVTGFGAAIKWDGCAKIDLAAPEGAADACVAKVQLPPGVYNGETIFAPRHEDPAKCKSEDDGWLLTYLHDENADKSYFAVFDALTMSSEPVALVALPQRVPYGFHALWVGESQLQAVRRGRPLAATSAAE